MNRDLEHPQGEPADHDPANARRRTRATLVATGAAAAVVVGTLLVVLPDRSPAPPVDTPAPTVTTSSTPTATVAPVVLPTGDPALPFGACGALADAAPAYAVDDRVVASVAPDAATLASGGFLAAGGVVDRELDGGVLAYAVPDDGPRVAVVQDGVVVGTTGFSPEPADVMSGRSGDDGEVTSFRGLLGLTVCDDGGAATAGRPLPAGTYELRPWADVVTYDDREEAPPELSEESLTFEQAVALGGTGATAVGEPTTVTVTGDAQAQLPLPGADVPLDRTTFAGPPACGAAAPAAPVRGAMLDLQVEPAATTLPSGSPLTATATVQYTGPGRLRVYGYDAIEYWVVQGGVVVGTTVQANDAFSQLDLGAGAPLGFAADDRALTSCIDDGGFPLSSGDPLPAGAYTVYPAWIFSDPVARTATETVELPRPDGTYGVTLGTPFPVTLT